MLVGGDKRTVLDLSAFIPAVACDVVALVTLRYAWLVVREARATVEPLRTIAADEGHQHPRCDQRHRGDHSTPPANQIWRWDGAFASTR